MERKGIGDFWKLIKDKKLFYDGELNENYLSTTTMPSEVHVECSQLCLVSIIFHAISPVHQLTQCIQ